MCTGISKNKTKMKARMACLYFDHIEVVQIASKYKVNAWDGKEFYLMLEDM